MLLPAPEGFARPDKAWATTLTSVDEETQTPLAVSLPTKSPEEGYTGRPRQSLKTRRAIRPWVAGR
eukprot:5755527-Heterocapsa_arctica.AAC.1